MKKIPSKPKRPIHGIYRYYDDVIEEVREKYPNPVNDIHYHRSIIKEMFEKLDKDEKKEKYLIPLRKETKIWKKKMEIYNKKYKKKSENLLVKNQKLLQMRFLYF